MSKLLSFKNMAILIPVLGLLAAVMAQQLVIASLERKNNSLNNDVLELNIELSRLSREVFTVQEMLERQNAALEEYRIRSEKADREAKEKLEDIHNRYEKEKKELELLLQADSSCENQLFVIDQQLKAFLER